MATHGENQRPPMGRTSGHHWGDSTATYGENLMAAVIRAVFADEAGQTGLPCSVVRPCARATSPTPRGPAVPNPDQGLADMAFAVT